MAGTDATAAGRKKKKKKKSKRRRKREEEAAAKREQEEEAKRQEIIAMKKAQRLAVPKRRRDSKPQRQAPRLREIGNDGKARPLRRSSGVVVSRRVFQAADLDGDGKLTADEFTRAQIAGWSAVRQSGVLLHRLAVQALFGCPHGAWRSPSGVEPPTVPPRSPPNGLRFLLN